MKTHGYLLGMLGFSPGPAFGSLQAGRPPALYILEADGRLRRVAPLPRFSYAEPFCLIDENIYRGRVRWSADGSAFLYLDADGYPLLLGWADDPTLWDVRTLLAGATDFRWARP